MASLRQIRSQLKSIQSTQQIMRAMQMVSASKLQRAHARLFAARPGFAYLDQLIQRLLADDPARRGAPAAKSGVEGLHPLFERRVLRERQTLVVVTSDTGLCSTYNAHLLTMAERFLEERKRTASGERWQIIPVGKRGARYFAKRGWPVAEGWLELGGRPDPVRLRAIGDTLVQRFLRRELDGLTLAFTTFVSPMVYHPTVESFLPLARPVVSRDAREAAVAYIYEPSRQRVLDVALPLWAQTKILVALLEALTSEHSARMIAMKNASDNATEMLDALTMRRNRIRQASITRELAEIVGTAEALK